MNKSISLSNFGLVSREAEKINKTFTVTKPNSCSLFMTQMINEMETSFLQKSSHVSLTKSREVKRERLSFMQKSSNFEERLDLY